MYLISHGELKQGLERLVEETGPKVEFLGQVPDGQLPMLYNRYPVFVQSSHLERTLKTLLKAMSCGTAVVGANVFGIRNLVTHRKNGMLAETEVASLRKALLELTANRDLQKVLGTAARDFILTKNTLDTYVEIELKPYFQDML